MQDVLKKSFKMLPEWMDRRHQTLSVQQVQHLSTNLTKIFVRKIRGGSNSEEGWGKETQSAKPTLCRAENLRKGSSGHMTADAWEETEGIKGEDPKPEKNCSSTSATLPLGETPNSRRTRSWCKTYVVRVFFLQNKNKWKPEGQESQKVLS